MKISIVIPVHNVPGRLLKECLDAALKQTLRRDEYEIVVIDDCSTNDETLATIAAAADVASNLRVIRHTENRGLNEARRSGVRAAGGDYIVFVDGDDILTRDAVEELRMVAHATNADFVTAPFFRWNYVGKRYADIPIVGKALPSNYIDRLRAVLSGEYSFTMCGRLFRRDILSDDVFDLPLGQLHEDVTTFVRILFKSKVVSHTKRGIYYYTFNPNSITNNFSVDHANGMFRGFDDWMANARRVGLLSELSQSMMGGVEKLVNICIERCALSDILGVDEKITILQDIDRKYSALPIPRIAPSLRGTKFLARFEGQGFAQHKGPIEDAIEESFPKPRQNGDGPTLPKGLQPSAMASRLKDKIVLIGQVDYQIRNAAVLARELRLRGYSCVILDNSAFASGGRRQLRPEESDIFGQAEHIKVEKSPYEADWLSTARLVVTFNDFNDDFREALEYRNRLGLPSVGMVEGINDFLRVDFAPYRHLPYRRCDYVFLAGEDDRRYFEDRQTHVVGLPIIEVLGSKQPSFPVKPTAVLNVNFTYGALEHERDGFLECATKAFAAAGVDYVITQHPMDKGNLEGLPVSDRTQYQLIDEGTVFVSRFATGILEALASGKPAVYFNPHAEKVEKFKAPMGALEIATTEGELVNALRRVLDDVEKGVDFRKRALPLLKRHTAYRSEGSSVSERFGDAVSSVLQENDRQRSISDLFFDALNTRKPFRENSSELIFGSLDRRHKARLNEEELISRFFGTREGIMIDVGTKAGGGSDIYLGKGWTIHTFEPFPDVGRRLPEARPSSSPLVVNEQAVSKEVGLNRTLPTGDVNTSTGKLPAIGEDNRQGSEVTATTLREYYEEHRLQHIEFLRIDARKNGKSVLEGIPWDRDRPDVILTTFDGQEMVPPGNALRDIAKLLVDRGYHVYVSEWLPSQQSVIGRDWSRLVRYSAGFDIGNTWGNVIGFVQAPDETELRLLVQEAVKFAAQPLEEKEVREKPYRAPERAFYAGFGEWLEPRSPGLFRLLQRLRRTTGQGMPTTRTELAAALRARSPALFRLGQIVSWTARAVRRHKLLTVLVAAACIALLVFPAFAQEVWGRRFGFWGAAVLLILVSVIAATLGEAFRRVLAVQEAALSAVRLSMRKQNLEIKELRSQLRDLATSHDQAMQAARAEVAALRSDLDKRTKETPSDGDVQNVSISRLQAGGRELSRLKGSANRSKRQ